MRQSLVALDPWSFSCGIHILDSIDYDCHICNNQGKYWKSFNSKIFKKVRAIDKDRIPNWVNIIKNEFSNWTDNQINSFSLQQLLHQLDLSDISNHFDCDLNSDDEIE